MLLEQTWNDAVEVRHPNIWGFIPVLKDNQAVHEAQVRGMCNVAQQPLGRRKWLHLEQRVIQLRNELTIGPISLDEYWNGICYVVHDECFINISWLIQV